MKNVGGIDRVLRIIIGLVLVLGPFLIGGSLWAGSVMTWGSVIIGAVLIATAGMSFCPLYRLIGISTR